MYFELVEIFLLILVGNYMVYLIIYIVYVDYGVIYGDVV